MWAFKPSLADYSASVAFKVVNPTGSFPSYMAGGVEQLLNLAQTDITPPVVSNFVPALNSVISSSQIISLDVTDNLWQLSDVLLMCKFSGTSLYEVVHDGNSFGPMYSTSIRTPISGGYTF